MNCLTNATKLYRSGLLSLGKASKLSGLSISEFIQHLASQGIDIVRYDETVEKETQDVSQWLS